MSNITRFDPFEDLFRGFLVRPVDVGSPTANQANATPSIRMDVTEQPQAYLVHAELPGVKKDDIHVTIDGNTVAISAEVKQEKEVTEGDRVLRSERYYGKVSRTFQLGQDVDEATAVAKFADGILDLTLPKRAASSSKRLKID